MEEGVLGEPVVRVGGGRIEVERGIDSLDELTVADNIEAERIVEWYYRIFPFSLHA